MRLFLYYPKLNEKNDYDLGRTYLDINNDTKQSLVENVNKYDILLDAMRIKLMDIAIGDNRNIKTYYEVNKDIDSMQNHIDGFIREYSPNWEKNKNYLQYKKSVMQDSENVVKIFNDIFNGRDNNDNERRID